MIDTDFDLLCDGANPAEAKCLRKILAEWCRGDENSFPVQLALLTKAQWRAVARLPQVVKESQKELEKAQTSHRALLSEQFSSAMEDARRLVSDSRKLLDAVQADHRRQIAAQSQSTIEAMNGSLRKLDTRLEVYNGVLENIATKICSKVSELEAVGQTIQGELNQGAESWNQAKVDFNLAREKMNEERERLEQRLTKRDWLAYLLVASLLFSFGLMLGVILWR
jgi:hypothetical protein